MFIFNNAPLILCAAGHRSGYADVLIMCKLYNLNIQDTEQVMVLNTFNSNDNFLILLLIILCITVINLLIATFSYLIGGYGLTELKCFKISNYHNRYLLSLLKINILVLLIYQIIPDLFH